MEPKNKEPKANQNEKKEEQTKPNSNIRRMIVALDKFLNKRIYGIGIFYFCAIIACGAGLIANGVMTHASSGGAGVVNSTDVWLFSAITVLTFLFVIIIARVISVRVRKKS